MAAFVTAQTKQMIEVTFQKKIFEEYCTVALLKKEKGRPEKRPECES